MPSMLELLHCTRCVCKGVVDNGFHHSIWTEVSNKLEMVCYACSHSPISVNVMVSNKASAHRFDL
jgi:hypothetical protein